MARKFRLTCARTTYFDLDLMAEDAVEAEQLLEAALTGNPVLPDGGHPVGKPLYRVVDIAAEEEAEGGLRDAAA